MTELLLPAGGLQAGLAAFEGGADSIYLGLTQFSARKEAMNFTLEEFAKIRTYAQLHEKQVFVAVNTLVEDNQIADVLHLLKQVAFIGCDGILVQDLGVAKLLKEHFPSLHLHASTQMAVHTIEGVKQLEAMGFSEVVLSRELTIQEIEKIRKACPSIKLEVFIHGALCYGFSGLCMASAKLCGRSANCGSCAQICRSFFDIEVDATQPDTLSPKPSQARSWCFSMSDLEGTNAIARLQAMGIDTLKVEGRMKGPAYTLAAAKYYRALLDGQKDTEQLRKDLQITFARRQTGGWLSDYGREGQDFTVRTALTLGSTSYPRHRGLKLGIVNAIQGYDIIVTLKEDVAVHDGLMYWSRSEDEPIGATKFSLNSMYDGTRRFITEAKAGETVAIVYPHGEQAPLEGSSLYVISRHDNTLPIQGKNLQRTKHPIALSIVLEKDTIIVETKLEFLDNQVRKVYPFEMTRANKPQDLEGTLNTIFRESDLSWFLPSDLTIINNTGFNDEDLFLPLSKIKAVRRDWYDYLDYLCTNYLDEPFILEQKHAFDAEQLPARNLLCTAKLVPFVDIQALAKEENPQDKLYRVLGKLYLPLPPVMFDEKAFLDALQTVVKKFENQGILPSIRFGLNNIAQVKWAKENPSCKVFCDIYLYLANSKSAEYMAEMLPENLVGGYLWLETKWFSEELWPFLPTVVNQSFNIPLFISRSCFRHDSLMLSCKNCPHQGSWYALINDKRFHVMVDNCITIVVEV
ncbi:MAG: peptidase U32 family protein [Sphaerochaetaceae bacterium]